MSRTQTRVPVSEESNLVHARGTEVFSGAWVANEGVVEGKVAWLPACITHKTQVYRVKTTTKHSPSIPGNLAWTLPGLAISGYGVNKLANLDKESDVQRCTTTEQGQESCTSDRRDATMAALAALLIGAPMAAAGVVTMIAAHDTKEDLGGPLAVRSEGKDLIACGTSADLKGAMVRLNLPGGPVLTGRLDDNGRATLQLPEQAEFDAENPLPIVVSSVPHGRHAFAAGQQAGSVDLRPYLRAQQQRRIEVMAQADRHEYEGAIHGDEQVKAGFTTHCTPSGSDDCYDAIDNDCDGLYDVGCGYQSGALQWTLAWRTGDDLDLHVIGPDGVHVWYRNKKGGPAGLELDVDCLGQFGSNCLAQNVENIFTPRSTRPMEGTYRGWVEVYRAVETDDAGRVVEAMLGGRLAGKTFRMPMRLLAQNQVRVHFAFAVGKDRDKDSIIDAQDACPDQPGVFSTVAREFGCPDQDMDGVADLADACPTESGVRSADPKKNGCPRCWGRARLTARGVEIDGTIQFATGSARLLAGSLPLLRDVARVMREVPQALQVIRIEGHTDDRGEAAKNYELSRARVKSVYDHLVKKEKIDSGRLKFAWFGESMPLPGADNATEKGRARNRRVEFRVLVPEPQISLSW
jgi:outer membrane protein OmpA-like peptidoglycan-associated protein